MSYQHPSDVFNEAHNLMNSLVEAYSSRQDMDTIRNVQQLVDDTVSTAQQREHEVQESIKALASQVSELEAGAAYSGAKAAHQARVARLSVQIEEEKGGVLQLDADIRSVSDQQAQLNEQQLALQQQRQDLEQQHQEEEPKKLHQISLYAHIAKLAFALDSVDAPIKRATISDPDSGAVMAINIDLSKESPWETADRIWAAL